MGEFDPVACRWSVSFVNGAVKALRPENIKLKSQASGRDETAKPSNEAGLAPGAVIEAATAGAAPAAALGNQPTSVPATFGWPVRELPTDTDDPWRTASTCSASMISPDSATWPDTTSSTWPPSNSPDASAWPAGTSSRTQSSRPAWP